MKIEIELQEIENLRARLQRSEEEVRKLEGELKANAEKQWEKKAIALAHNLLDHYFTAVFDKLGFTSDNNWYREAQSIRWGQYLGDKWWENKDKLKISIGASIWEESRSAFINIRVIPDDWQHNGEPKTMLSEIC